MTLVSSSRESSSSLRKQRQGRQVPKRMSPFLLLSKNVQTNKLVMYLIPLGILVWLLLPLYLTHFSGLLDGADDDYNVEINHDTKYVTNPMKMMMMRHNHHQRLHQQRQEENAKAERLKRMVDPPMDMSPMLRRGKEGGGGGGKIPLEVRQQEQNRNPFKRQWMKSKRFVDTIEHVHPKAQRHSNVTIDMKVLNQELPFDDKDGGVWKQGWDVQPKQIGTTQEEPIQHIYVIPHSHCDPGWIKTFDDYFQSQTKQILTTVTDALEQDPKRTFIWAEISYFEWWWKEQTPAKQERTRKLLETKQLEFVTGGWVQPDEANTELYAMEIQLQEGHDWIRQTFGDQYVPKYGWAIDPFGYSPTMAYLLKKYKFQAMLIQRVHYAIKKELAQHQHLEFIWRQTWDTSAVGEYDIFTHVMPFYSYDVPHTCGPDPSVCCEYDFARQNGIHTTNGERCPWGKHPQPITKRNVEERSLHLLDQYLKKASLYRGNSVLIPLGDDFRYQSKVEAEAQFTNYQKIFDYINQNVNGVQIQFGTLSQYFESVQETFDPPLLKGSFFTYSDREQDYWSGYFTSRVFDKALDRSLERSLFAATSMGATKEEMQQSRRSLSLFQHHDGVTGTAKNHVVDDYAQRMYDAIHDTQQWMSTKLQHDYGNYTQHAFGGGNEKEVVPGGESKKPTIEFEPCWKANKPRDLTFNKCMIEGDEGKAMDVVVYNPLQRRQWCGNVEVSPQRATRAKLPCEVSKPLPHSKLKFDSQTGLMTYPIKEEWMVWKVRKGGAYLFFPGTLEPYPIVEEQVVIEENGYIVSTPYWKRRIVERMTIGKGGEATVVVDFIFETNLQMNNHEWIVRFTSDNIANDGVFHTDLNGFNFDTHKFRQDMPIQSQVFPMPTLASVEDYNTRMTVLSEHAQGTASLEKGSIDIWLDRRLSQDDNRGLGQGVQDNVPTRTRLRLLLEPSPLSATQSDKKKGKNQDLFLEEFRITQLCKDMWEELNHPLEMFRVTGWEDESKQQQQQTRVRKEDEAGLNEGEYDILPGDFGEVKLDDSVSTNNKRQEDMASTTLQQSQRVVVSRRADSEIEKEVGPKPLVPFVYMVYKRVDYFKKAMHTLIYSDFDRDTTPLIVSIDGSVPEMKKYVESLKTEFPKLIVLVHPYSCYDHPDTFPGNDESLNKNYGGDKYGNPREYQVTCAKHHFAWMIKTVFTDLNEVKDADGFLFMEEDYIVAPTVYETVWTGLYLLRKLAKKGHELFGVGMDPTRGGTENPNFGLFDKEGWYPAHFSSGPMVLTRPIYQKFIANADEFCKFDDYNWDWSVVHMMDKKLLPGRVLQPSEAQTVHIGTEGGMHDHGAGFWIPFSENPTEANPFHGKKIFNKKIYRYTGDFWNIAKGFGGWGHPQDQEHCLKVLGKSSKSWL